MPRSPSFHINTFSSPKLFRVVPGNLWQKRFKKQCDREFVDLERAKPCLPHVDVPLHNESRSRKCEKLGLPFSPNSTCKRVSWGESANGDCLFTLPTIPPGQPGFPTHPPGCGHRQQQDGSQKCRREHLSLENPQSEQGQVKGLQSHFCLALRVCNGRHGGDSN